MQVLFERVEPELADLEAQYRQRHLRADIEQTQIFALVIILASLAFLPVDYSLFREHETFLGLMFGLRTVGALCSSVASASLPQPTYFDRLVLGYLVALAILQGLSASPRPATYYGSFVFDFILILCCYLVVPTILSYRLAGTFVASLGSLLSLFLVREPSLLYGTSIPIALVGVHLIGLLGSTRIYTYRRHAYQAIVAAQQLNEQLTVLAEVDGLTGVFNRRKLLELGATEFLRYQRYGHRFSVVLTDVDYFKRVNDEYGHAAGDAVLIGVAQVLGAATRTSDVLGRLGGEEFAVLLPETPQTAALVVAERIRAQVQRTTIAIPHGQIAVTLSAGVVEVAPIDRSFEDVLHRADQLLYRAKACGRNRVAG